MPELLQAIQAGGNIALMAIAVAIYKLDRRVLTLEFIVRNLEKNHGEIG